MIKGRWRNARSRSSNSNGGSIGSSSVSGSSFEGTNSDQNSRTFGQPNKHIQFPKGCLKIELLKLYDGKLMGSNRIPGPIIRKIVTFQHVYIREYERTVGDNPSCSSGAPVRYA